MQRPADAQVVTRRPDLPTAGLGALIDSIVSRSMQADKIPGAEVVVVQNGKTVFAKGYGFANVERQTPVDVDRTIFRIGSISKLVTAMGVMSLVDRQRAQLDAPVSTYMSSPTIVSRFSEPVRVRHLLTHTAGLDQIGDESRRLVWSSNTRQSLTDFLSGQLKVIRRPGTAASYDTYGMTLAGLLIERVAAEPYADFMRRHVFSPLGMTRTFVEVPDSLRDDLAPGYGWKDGRWEAQRYEYYASTPASSIDATGSDMARLMVALLGDGSNSHGRLFSPKIGAMIKTVQFAPHPSVPVYSYGFWEAALNGQRVLYHGGAMLGYETDLFLLPDYGVGVYVAYNHNGEAGGPRPQLRNNLRADLIEHWFPQPLPAAPSPLPIPTARFEGFYGDATYCHMCYEGDGWRIPPITPVRSAGPGLLQIGQERLIAVDSLLFVFERNPRRKLAFVADEKGEIAYGYWPREGSARERRSDRMLDEMLGPGWQAREVQPQTARVYRDTERWSDCATAYQALLKQRPTNGQSAFYGGQCALRANRLDDAITLLGSAWRLDQWRNHAAFNLGAAYARRAQPDSAFSWLSEAVRLQYPNLELLDRDSAFTTLRGDPRFAALRRPKNPD